MFGHKCSRIRQVTSSSLSWSVTPRFCSSNIRTCFLLVAQDGCVSSGCRIQIPTNRKGTLPLKTLTGSIRLFFSFLLISDWPVFSHMTIPTFKGDWEVSSFCMTLCPLATGLVFLTKEERMSIRERFVLLAPCRNRPFTVEIRTAHFKSKLTRNF